MLGLMVSIKDDVIRKERSSLAIRSLLLLIDLNKEIKIVTIDESQDITEEESTVQNIGPMEFMSFSPEPEAFDPLGPPCGKKTKRRRPVVVNPKLHKVKIVPKPKYLKKKVCSWEKCKATTLESRFSERFS